MHSACPWHGTARRRAGRNTSHLIPPTMSNREPGVLCHVSGLVRLLEVSYVRISVLAAAVLGIRSLAGRAASGWMVITHQEQM